MQEREFYEKQWEIVNELVKNEGRPERIAKLDTKSTAMIVIDMQNRFVAPGASVEVPGARDIVPNINNLARACREVGIPVIWVIGGDSRSPHELGLIPTFMPRSPMGTDRPTPAEEALDPRSVALWPELHFDQGRDYVIGKCRYGVFVSGASRLERLLRNLKRDTLIMTGVATNVCTGLAAMEAMMLDFKVAYVSDGSAAFTEFLQQAFLMNLKVAFADVVTTSELLEELEQLK